MCNDWAARNRELEITYSILTQSKGIFPHYKGSTMLWGIILGSFISNYSRLAMVVAKSTRYERREHTVFCRFVRTKK
jgi:hypothetical protein